MCLFLLFFILLTLFCCVCLANRTKMRNFALVIELEKHIEILLLDNDCVIVPGLGGFVAHYVGACFDKDSNMFLPPYRTLGFNSKLDMNDSLLAQSYVEAYDISYPEALRKIDSEVVELKRTLEVEGIYELDNIGVISINNEGNYEFEPCEAGVLTPGLYGLVGVDLQRLEAEAEGKNATSLVVTPVPDSTGPSESSLNAGCCVKTTGTKVVSFSNTVEENAAYGKNERVISVKVSVLRNILAVACSIVAFFMLATPISNDVYNDGKKIGNIGSGLLYNLIPRDGGMQNVQLYGVKLDDSKGGDSNIKDGAGRMAENNGRICSKPASIVIKTSVEDAKSDEGKKESRKAGSENLDESGYCIVLACRITKSNAEEYVRKLHSDGYLKVRLEGENGGSLKVVYGNYSSEEKALSELNAFRNKGVFKDAWIYHVK